MTWASSAFFYHLYPLGCLDAPARNDFHSQPVPRLAELHAWLDEWEFLGVNALYLGPLFESTAHGYETADYLQVDRRLGTDETLRTLSGALHERGIRLVLDGVFNHVGRHFWAFRDVQAHGAASRYRDWFHLDFSRRSPQGDPFWYQGWNGHYDLVKLNLRHPEVRAHLFEAVRLWVERFDIDGLRLDAADVMDLDFLKELATFCHGLRPGFWLMGEVIHGDYRRWLDVGLDSVTNYEAYKGLYSSHKDRNYFELAHSLNRQFGPEGIYQNRLLYSFADNHDVNRVSSRLRDPHHLSPLYALLMTMPGIPSVYYGSERGLAGVKTKHSDAPLRPALTPQLLRQIAPHPGLPSELQRLARLRVQLEALRHGDYAPLHVSSEQFAFARTTLTQQVIVAVNASKDPQAIPLTLPTGTKLKDCLSGEAIATPGGRLELQLAPYGSRILAGPRS